MTLIFNKTTDEIQSEILTNLPAEYQTTIGFDIWEWSKALSHGIKLCWDKIAYICGWNDIRNMDLSDMINFVYQLRGIEYRNAVKATGYLTLTGTDTVTAGNLFETSDGLRFKALETVVITNSGTVKAECLTAGLTGNVPVGQITEFVTYKGNFISVTNATAFEGGAEAEKKDELYNRFIEDVTEPKVSGNIYFYKKWAKEVAGVGDAKIKPLWNGDNTVKVVIIDNNYDTADNTLVNAVQAYIDPYTLTGDVKFGWGCGNGQAPIGAYCTVESATAKKLTVSAQIILAPTYNLSAVTTSIENNIKSYLREIAFKQNYVSFAKIGSAILETDGVLDYSNLTLNGKTINIAVDDTSTSAEVAVLDDLIITQA